VAFVDAGRNHTFIIKTDASLWVWGENSDGQLGLGDYNDRITPVKSRDNVTLVSAGSRHSIVVAGDSSLWASGFNAFGRLCDSTVNNTNRLVRSMAGSRAEARRPFAVKRPGTGLSAWAAPKVNTLSGAGLVPALINKDFQQDITRKELAYLLVPVFERLTGRKLDPMPTDSPFRMSADYLEDTTLAAYLEINMESELTTEARHVMTKAHYGGFMDIIGRRKFQPETVVFQEELYGILMTLADRAGLTVSANTSGVRLQDESSVDPALLNLVKTAYALGIKSGQPGADLNVEPKKPASRELALYLTQLLVEKAPGLKAAGALQRPVMRYGYVGTYGGTWTHEAQHSSPVLADFGGGKLDIISSSYIIVSIDAKTGKENWRAPVGYDRGTDWRTVAQDTRTWSDPVIADIDGDGQKEIVIAHDNGKISVLTQDGYFKPGWERKVVAQGRHLRSMVVADLDKNGKLSIIVGVAELNPINVWVFDCYGNVRTGWPQRPDKAGDDSWDRYTLGIYNNNISVADINGDGFPEIFVPSDTKMMAVYDRAGNDILTGSLFGNAPWARLGFWVDYEYDKNTDPFKNMTHRKDPETTPDSERDLMQPAFSQAVIADLDGNGTPEIVIAGHVIDSIRGWPPSKGIGLFVLNADRSRYNTQHGNWERIPITGAPLSSLAEGDAALQRARYNPVVADLDGDGRMEILFASSDGKLHCYSLDKTQKNSWPYTVGTRSELEWASVPVCTDLDGDGRKEVIFTTWTDREGGKTGRLVVLNYKGEVVMETKLPYPVSQFTNGGMSTPVIADIDGRGQYSIIVGTSLSGIVVYDLPGSTTKAPTTPPTTPPAPPSAPSATPYPNVGVTLDGVKVPVQVYGINGNIYLRLSDLAIAVGINASWNGAVQLDTTKPAGSSTPGEMPTGPVEATPYPNVKVYLDGTEIPVNVYGIDGSTVLALGEVARALNLNPSWENGTAVLTR
ncbi:MAG: FG-GAP-like repeat-containing protein, partial [Oscillospiraceae bacterium]|nr:FG-GAP-like repeat-containing protein [Oscillospiraceae bacterium]